MSNFLRRKVNTIFLMLGNECNMNCKYCMQHDLVDHPLSALVNPDIYNFITELAGEYKESEGCPNIQLYGGEPLLYFDTIRKVMDTLRNTKVTFSVISNGKAITDEMVDFFNERNISVTISWDGHNVLKTRGYDVFAKDSPQRDRLLRLDRLGVSAVVSSLVYPKSIIDSFQELNEDYNKLHDYDLYFNIDEIFNTGNVPDDLCAVDFDRVEEEMFGLSKQFLAIKLAAQPVELKDRALFAVLQRMYDKIISAYGKEDTVMPQGFCGCGNGYSVINLDLEGKLYPCHNTSTACGDINSSYFQYLRNVISTDRVIARTDTCKDCLALAFCGRGCKLVPPEKMEVYCKLKKAMFIPLLSLVQQLGTMLPKEKPGDVEHGS